MNRRSMLKTASAAAMGGAVLTGCSTPDVTAYSGQTPAFDLRSYFNGNVQARGMFRDRAGKIVRRFVVVLQCEWRGDQGVLDESFTYDDGEKQRRIWRLTDLGQNRYLGLADDVVGQAHGQGSGNAFRWQYTLRLPVDGTTYDVELDDWMVLIDERTVINVATMSKFSVRLGEVTLAFTK